MLFTKSHVLRPSGIAHQYVLPMTAFKAVVAAAPRQVSLQLQSRPLWVATQQRERFSVSCYKVTC